jgi:MFS family permease
MASAVMLMGLATAYWVLLPLAALAAVGNSVFHPADISILSAKVSPQRIGRAFGVHGFGGTFGYFLSPIVIYYGVVSFAGWRAGLIVAGLIGWAAVLLIFRYRAVLRMPLRGGSGPEPMPGLAFYVGLATNRPLIAAFCFFALTAGALIGMQNFSVTALVELHAAPLYLATAGLTAFLGGSAAGIVVGGELADRLPRHAAIATAGLALGASLMAGVALISLPLTAVIVVLAAAGFCVGATNPSRDILVRVATPPGATGKVFGFVYSGLDLGGAVGPLMFGWLLDGGHARGIFLAIAALYALGILSVTQLTRAQKPAQAAAD